MSAGLGQQSVGRHGLAGRSAARNHDQERAERRGRDGTGGSGPRRKGDDPLFAVVRGLAHRSILPPTPSASGAALTSVRWVKALGELRPAASSQVRDTRVMNRLCAAPV